MFISAWDIQKQAVVTGSKGDPAKEVSILFAIDTAKAKKSEGTVHYVRMRIGTKVIEQTGWKPGMRAVLEYAPDKGVGRIVRLPDDSTEGWILAGLKRNADGAQPLQLRFTWHEKQPSIAAPALCTKLKTSDNAIEFTFPKGTSFGDLATEVHGSADGQTVNWRRRKDDRPARTRPY